MCLRKVLQMQQKINILDILNGMTLGVVCSCNELMFLIMCFPYAYQVMSSYLGRWIQRLNNMNLKEKML